MGDGTVVLNSTRDIPRAPVAEPRLELRVLSCSAGIRTTSRPSGR